MNNGRALLKALLSSELVPDRPLDCSDILASELVNTGLGPVVFDAARRGLLIVSEPALEVWHSSDLTARAIFAKRCRVQQEVEKCLNSIGIRSAPLKGASIANRYPQPHWRIMSDIDLLVERHELAEAMAALRCIGYTNAYPDPGENWDTHHHATPLIHPQHRVCVELHHSLDSSEWFDGPNLKAEEVWKECINDVGSDGLTCRLSRRLELNYFAAHWYLHLIENPDTPGLQRALFDVSYLLADETLSSDWFFDDRRLSFATLTLLTVLDRLGVTSIRTNELIALMNEQQIDEIALDFVSKLIERKLCSLTESPRIVTMQIQSRWLELALTNDNPARFTPRIFCLSFYIIFLELGEIEFVDVDFS